jgi:hypothetical protein
MTELIQFNDLRNVSVLLHAIHTYLPMLFDSIQFNLVHESNWTELSSPRAANLFELIFQQLKVFWSRQIYIRYLF